MFTRLWPRVTVVARTAPLLPLLWLCGCFYVGVDIEEVRTRIVQSSLTVPASENTNIGTEIAAANTCDFDLREQLDDDVLEWVDHVALTRLRALPGADLRDLDFVQAIEVRMEAIDSVLPEVTAARYARENGSVGGDGSLELAIDETIEYRHYVTHPVRFHIETRFAYPGKAWSFDIDLGLELGFGYQGELL